MRVPVETVRTDRFEMDFFRFGSGASPLVIIPGLSVQSVMPSAPTIADAYAIMKNDFTVFVFDRRKRLPATYSVKDMAEDTVLAVEALGLRDLYIVGASQGGMIALEIAADRPDLVKKIAVASTPLKVSNDRFKAIESWIEKAKQGDGAGLYSEFAKRIYPQKLYEEYKSALTMIGSGVTGEELRRFITLAEGARGFDFSCRAHRIRCPLLVASSLDDGIFGSAIADGFKEVFDDRSGVEYLVYEGFGHAVYDTAPDFKEKLYRFMTES